MQIAQAYWFGWVQGAGFVVVAYIAYKMIWDNGYEIRKRPKKIR